MRHLFKTTAIASSLVAASFFVGTGMANAQVATFNGNVPTSCTFGASTAQTLTLTDGKAFSTAIPVAMTLNCAANTATALSVGAPVVTNSPANTIGTLTSDSSVAFTGLIDGVAAGPVTATDALAETLTGSIVNGELAVSMNYGSTDLLLPGTYEFTVTVVATPN